MSEAKVKEALAKAGLPWEDFVEWMDGQTVGLNPDGSFNYYDWDVASFIDGGGKRTPIHD